MDKIAKTSIVLSNLILGVSLSATVVLNDQKFEIDGTHLDNTFYLSNNSELVNKGINGKRLDINKSINSSIFIILL